MVYADVRDQAVIVIYRSSEVEKVRWFIGRDGLRRKLGKSQHVARL